MGKAVIVTYQEIRGVKPGREERDGFLIHSGRQAFLEGAVMPKSALKADLASADQIFVFVGKIGMELSREFLREAKTAGKQTFMFGCPCEENKKRQLQKELGIEWLVVECDNEMIHGDLLDLMACGVRR